MYHSRALYLALAAALAAGCRHVPPQPLSPEESAARLTAQSLADVGLRDFLAQQTGRSPEPWPKTQWDLEDLTLAALYFSPELRVARAGAAVAAAHVGAESQRPNPTVSVLPQRVANPESGVSPWLAAVQLDWPIETAGKRAKRRAAAERRAAAADLSVNTAVWRVRGDVYEGVVGVSAAAQRSASLARTVELRAQRLSLIEERRIAGAIAEAIVAPERLALAQATANLASAERTSAEARAALAAAVGTPAAALDAVDVAFDLDAAPADAQALGNGARRAALLSRSDVLSLLAEYEAAEQDLRLELAKQYPDLHIGPAYEYDQGADKWGLALSLDLPLMNQNGGAIDEALARRGEVAARFEALQAQVIHEVDAAETALRAARREAEIAQHLLAEARHRNALAERSLELGAVDRVAVLDAELEMQFAAGARIDAQERLHRALAQLERAVEAPAQPGASG